MRKYIILLFVLSSIYGKAQIKGNKEIETRKFATEEIRDIEVGIYGDITVDAALENVISITTDSNLFQYIDTEVVNGKLKLDQLKWIQPSERIKIVVGAPVIRRVQLGTNDRLHVINLNTDQFNAMALNGTIHLEGSSAVLNIGCENGTVDASQMKTEQLFLNIWGMGKASFDTAKSLDAKLSDEAELEFRERPLTVKGSIDNALARSMDNANIPVRFINFKIRNNSSNRQNFYVIGPKPDGNKFSYGFPMMPGAVRKENWTNGTRIYKVSGLGLRKLLVTIELDDENQIVDLF